MEHDCVIVKCKRKEKKDKDLDWDEKSDDSIHKCEVNEKIVMNEIKKLKNSTVIGSNGLNNNIIKASPGIFTTIFTQYMTKKK